MECFKKISLPVALLVAVFGWSSWIDINGLWVELPILVNELPEKWYLPAYFVVIIQLANIGPLIYGLAYKYGPKNKRPILETATIYMIVIIGAVSLLLLSFFWRHTSVVFGENHSTALLTLTFFLSLVDCTSSVTFIPFMGQFKPIYMTAFYIGEGLSGMLPTALSFIQGSGEYTCVEKNTTTTYANTTIIYANGTAINGTMSWNVTTLSVQPKTIPLLFPVSGFFLILFAMLIFSLLSFSILKYTNISAAALLSFQNRKVASESEEVSSTSESTESDSLSKSAGQSTEKFVESEQTSDDKTPFREYILLLVFIAIISGVGNSALPSLQTFSLLPYGHIYYSVGVKLATLANPVACFFGFFILTKRIPTISVLFLLSMVCASYIIAISSYSPHPPVNSAVAAVFMVLVWILFTGIISYLKVAITTLLIKDGATALLWLGAATQIGSIVGAVISFICVTVLQLLQQAPNCVSA